MNSKILVTALPLLIAALLTGCGGNGEDAASPAGDSDGMASAGDDSQTQTALDQVMDQIDKALDDGNYSAAVSLTAKGKTVQDKLELIDYVGRELGSGMAAGDTGAHAAYRKLNQFREMQRMRMR